VRDGGGGHAERLLWLATVRSPTSSAGAAPR
jgi:hypothetical protein